MQLFMTPLLNFKFTAGMISPGAAAIRYCNWSMVLIRPWYTLDLMKITQRSLVMADLESGPSKVSSESPSFTTIQNNRSTLGHMSCSGVWWYEYFILALEPGVLSYVRTIFIQAVPPEQAGFRTSFSTTDHLQTINQLIEKSEEFNLPLYLGFVDYSKAFDSIEHRSILQALSTQGVEGKYIRLLSNIYRHNFAKKMNKTSTKVRAKWATEDLKFALQAIKSGLPVAAASRQYNIPRRTLRDWMIRNKSPERKLGRCAVLSPDLELELKRIVRLQQVGFGLTRLQVRSCCYKICEENNIPHPFKNEIAGKDWLYGFLKRFPDIVLRKAENLSYGRLMRFNKEIVSDFFELLKKTLIELDLCDKPQLLYNVDESGLQLTYSSSQLVLAQKGSKRVHTATHSDRGETVTVVACTNATGSNWIPPMILYKGKSYLMKHLLQAMFQTAQLQRSHQHLGPLKKPHNMRLSQNEHQPKTHQLQPHHHLIPFTNSSLLLKSLEIL
ncbi:hypothetical protein ANN_03012 [Periplaneta americana]|uniref:Uncharacterized protein n=1 Tax=Periplaneta americana TaxID=6978 RepID=A0ABQ8U0F0_PERAM|nr:hypothetical protein ANN_03012 [Periplaneta americana]